MYLYKIVFLMAYTISLTLAIRVGSLRDTPPIVWVSLAVVFGCFLVFVWLVAAQTRCLDPIHRSRGRRSLAILLGYVLVIAGVSAGCGWFLSWFVGISLVGGVLVFSFAAGFFGAIELSPLKFGNQDIFGYLVPGGCGALVASLFGLSAFREGWDLRETLEHLVLLLCWSAVCWAVFEIRLRRPAPKQATYPSTGKAMSLSFMDETR